MPRPTVDADRRDRLEELVDEEGKLPASALTFDQQLEVLLDTYEGYKKLCEQQSDTIDRLERELEEAKADDGDGTNVAGPRGRGGGRNW